MLRANSTNNMNSEISDKQTLIRGLGLIAAVSIIIGNVIGTGVFLKARVMTCNVGSPTWVLLAWVAAGLLSLAGALTYAELTAMKPQAGGEYVFLRDAYGRVSSFLFGWMQMFIAKPGSQAAAGMAFAIGMNDFLDKQLEKTLLSVPLGDSSFEITTLQIVAIMVIVIFTTLNCATVTLSGNIATALTFVKIALILFVGVGAFIWVSGNFSHFSLFSSSGTCEGVADSVKVGSPNYTFLGGFGAAMLAALWGYDGWNNLTFVAGEVKDPNRNIPLAIIGSTILVIVLYVFVHIGYFYVLDPTTIASVSKSSSVAKTVVSMFFGGDATSIATGAAIAFFTVGLMLSSSGNTAYFDPFGFARPLCHGPRRPDVQVIWQAVDQPCSGHGSSDAGLVGLFAGTDRVVRYAYRLCDLWLVDILCPCYIVGICFQAKVSRFGEAIQSIWLSGHSGRISSGRRMAAVYNFL